MRKEPQLIRLDSDENLKQQPMAVSKTLQTWRVFISNLKLKGLIGIYPSEKIEQQSIVISVSAIYRASVPDEGSSEHVVCYQQLVKNIEKLI